MYSGKDAAGSITWASSDMNLEKVKIDLLFIVIPPKLQY
jgi:hypothetical protein